MKVYINYRNDNHDLINNIFAFDYWINKGKSEKEIEDTIVKHNENVNWEQYKIMDIPESMEEVVKFLLGEDKYKKHKSITSLYDILRDIKDDIESIQDDCFHVMESLDEQIKKVEEVIPEDDRY